MNTTISSGQPVTCTRPRSLLEPVARKAGTAGSEGAPAQQCAGATRRDRTVLPDLACPPGRYRRSSRHPFERRASMPGPAPSTPTSARWTGGSDHPRRPHQTSAPIPSALAGRSTSARGVEAAGTETFIEASDLLGGGPVLPADLHCSPARHGVDPEFSDQTAAARTQCACTHRGHDRVAATSAVGFRSRRPP